MRAVRYIRPTPKGGENDLAKADSMALRNAIELYLSVALSFCLFKVKEQWPQ
jgi:hypothetical protein